MLSSPSFFFNHPATTEIYTFSLHDALPILATAAPGVALRTRVENRSPPFWPPCCARPGRPALDRKSTRLNSSHVSISYAVFCLKKKKVASEFVQLRMHDSCRFCILLGA